MPDFFVIITGTGIFLFLRSMFGAGLWSWIKATVGTVAATLMHLFSQDMEIAVTMGFILFADWGVSLFRERGFLHVTKRSGVKMLSYAIAFLIVSAMAHSVAAFSWLYVPMGAYCIGKEGGSVLLRLGEESAVASWWRSIQHRVNESINISLGSDDQPHLRDEPEKR